MTPSPSIVLFHSDLRLADNPALMAAVRRGHPLICLYVWNGGAKGFERPGAASRWWLHHSLHRLTTTIQEAGNSLIFRQGQPLEVLAELLEEFNDPHVFWNRSCEPAALEMERNMLNMLERERVPATHFHGTTLTDPLRIQTQAHKPYCVFTPFWKNLRTHLQLSPPLPAPKKLPPLPSKPPRSESLNLLPISDWATKIQDTWDPGEEGARAALQKFLRNPAKSYAMDRDRPDLPHTSRLSPHLHFGEISPRKVWYAIQRAMKKSGAHQNKKSFEAYLRQIGWREFARYLLFHFPKTVHSPLDAAFETFPWRQEANLLKAWQQGLTGYPIVDAGMRELWQTGWMHNRVRMITASFLTKDLLQSWRKGADWFWDTLVDADLANNTLGWQWVAGCGAEASPFFRIFNPTTQGITFDPEGAYVRQWVPELANLPSRWIHQPWDAPPGVLAEAQIRLGITYPHRIVDHKKARDQALMVFQKFKKDNKSAKVS